jgi:D-alanyl-D-alanine carboxypeptidase
MTSGIPSYERQSAFLADYVADPYANVSTERLVSYAAQAPATSGYSYSNTNYILAQMIIEKASRNTYDHQLYSRIIDPLGLHDLTFSRHLYPATITAREPAGYFFLNEIPALLGDDASRHSLSFAQGAGGIVGTTREMTRWERALYSGQVLPPTQQAELLSVVSTKTGQPIGKTSTADPAGYGLGVQQGTTQKFGTFWTYEGGTFGFRTLHLYLPESGLIMAIGLNSQASSDHVMTLAGRVYDTLLAKHLITAK